MKEASLGRNELDQFAPAFTKAIGASPSEYLREH